MEKFNYIILSLDSREVNGNVSLIETFNSISAERLPVAIPVMWVTANIELDDREHSCRIAINRLSDSTVIGEINFNNVTTQDSIAHEVQLRGNFSNMLFEQEGEYRITLSVDSVEVGFRKVFVTLQAR